MATETLAPPITTTPAAFGREEVARLSDRKREPDWMRQKRFESWIAFDTAPWPRWERTDIRKLNLAALRPVVEPTPFIGQTDRPDAVRAAARGGYLLHGEGGVGARCMDATVAGRGVIFTDLDTAVQQHPELVQRYFLTDCIRSEDGKFQALSGAFWNGGTFLYVPKQLEVELPIASQFVLVRGGVAWFGHTVIVLERGAKLTYIESHTSSPAEGDALYTGLTEVFVGEGAQFTHVQLQDWRENVWDFSHRRVLLERDASLTSVVVTLGSRLSRLQIETLLRGEGASANMKGLFIAREGQHLTHDTLQDHRVPHTSSDLLYKGALRGRSRTVFEGLIRVHPNAQKTNAYQASRNLLLDPHARADALPMLEIGANDVRCTHGATVGPVDREHLFYLRTRGLSRQEAERLVVRGFFDPVMQAIPVPALRDVLWGRIDEKLVRP